MCQDFGIWSFFNIEVKGLDIVEVVFECDLFFVFVKDEVEIFGINVYLVNFCFNVFWEFYFELFVGIYICFC